MLSSEQINRLEETRRGANKCPQYATKQDVLIGNPNEQCLPFEGTANDIQRMFGNEDPNYEKLLRLIRPLLELPSMSNLLEGPTGSTNSAPDNKPSDAHAQGAELPELAGTPGADALPEVAPGTRLEQTIADLELERIEALELGLVRIVISLPSRETSKGKIDVPLAALLDIESSQNSVSQTFVNQILDDYDWDIQKSTGRNKQMTLDFRPARGGTAQSRYFVVRDDIPHPMILAGVGLFSGRGTRDYMKRNPSLSPATDDYQPTVTQDAGGPQFPTRVVTTMPCQRPVTSTLGGFNEVSFPAGPGGSNLQVQGNLISSTQALPKSIVSRTLESGRELARGVAAASESSTWGPSTGITLAAGVTGVGMLANSGYASYVATKALHQTKRSAEISEQSLALHREVFEYTKASKPAAGAGTGPKSSNPTSDSDSDSGDVDSHIGGSSSKSASLRVIQGRTTTPVAASPQRMQRSKVFLQGAAVKGPWTKSDRGNVSALHTRTLLASAPSAPHGPLQPHSNSLPSLTSSHESDINMRRLRETRAPTHNFDASIRPLESVTSHTVDGSEIQMDDLDSRRDVVVVSPERLQPGNRTDSDSLPATRAVLLHTAQYHQLSTEENQDNIARNENAMTAETPSFPTTFDTRAPPPTGDRVVSELGDIDDATERLSLQQGSINSLDEQRQFRERETEPGAEASALQSDEKNSSKISVVDSNFHQTELLGEKTPNTLVKDKREEQEGPETPRYDESTGDTGGNTASRKGLEPAELLETQFLISSSLLSTDVDRANKDGHDCKIQDAQSQHHRTEGLKVEGEEGEGQVVEENEVERKDIIGGEVERHEAENKEVKGEQVEDVETKSRNAEASTKDEGELRTKDE